jgi:hypothetical protein
MKVCCGAAEEPHRGRKRQARSSSSALTRTQPCQRKRPFREIRALGKGAHCAALPVAFRFRRRSDVSRVVFGFSSRPAGRAARPLFPGMEGAGRVGNPPWRARGPPADPIRPDGRGNARAAKPKTKRWSWATWQIGGAGAQYSEDQAIRLSRRRRCWASSR